MKLLPLFLFLFVSCVWHTTAIAQELRKNGSSFGKVESDGTVRISGSSVGKIESDGTVRKNGSSIGTAKGVKKEHAAVIFFFDFFN